MKNILFLLFAAALMGACDKNEFYQGTRTMIVASERRMAGYGIGYALTLVVKFSERGEWEYLHNNIEGFDYESGYEYVLQVGVYKIKNPPADGSSIKYVLNKVISQTLKDSDGLPAEVVPR